VLAPAAAVDALMQFFAGRLDYMLTREGITYDTSRAALAAPWTDALEVWERAAFLNALRTSDPALFDQLVTAAERPARITRPEDLPEAGPDPAGFAEPREAELWQAAQSAATAVDAALASTPADYAAAIHALAASPSPSTTSSPTSW